MILDAAIGIINNAALLVTLGVLYSLVSIRWKMAPGIRQAGYGVLIGLVGIALMLNPWTLGPGLFFDTRSILISCAGLFFGPVSTGIAILICGVFRWTQGGAGVWMGIAVVVTSGAWGMAWTLLRSRREARFGWWELLLFGLAVHLTMLTCTILLPAGERLRILTSVGPVIIVIYPLGTMLLGKLLDTQRSWQSSHEETRRSEQWLRRLFEQAWGITSLIDQDGRFVYVSESAHGILGYIPGELSGRPFDCLLHPEEREELGEAFRRLLDSPGGRAWVEHRMLHETGRWVWVETVGTNLLSDPTVNAVVANTRDITERRKSLEQEKRLLEMTGYVIRHDPGATAVLDRQFRLLFASEKLFELANRTEGELIGKRVEDLFPAMPAHWKEACLKALSGEVVNCEEESIVLEDGREETISWQCRPWGAADGTVDGIIVYTKLITERKQREEMHSLILRGALDGHFSCDRDLIILEVNDSFCRMIGCERHEVLGKSLLEFETIDSPEEAVERRERIVRNGAERFESRYRRPDGERIDVDVSITYGESFGGRFFVFVRDITERKRVVAALIRQRQRLANIIEGTDVATWEYNAQTGHVVIDERWAQMVGHSLKELEPIGFDTWESRVHPDDLPIITSLLNRHLTGEIPRVDCEFRMRHKDGGWVWVLDRGKVLEWDEEGRPLLMFGTHTDITARKRAESEGQLLVELMEHSKNELFVFSVDDLRLIRVSRGARDNLGYSLEELQGMTAVDLKPDFTEAEFRRMLRPLVNGERDTVQVFTTHQRRDGTLYPVEAHVTYHPENGLFLAVAIDVTDRREAQEALSSERNLLRELTNASPIAIVFSGRDGLITFANPSAGNLLDSEDSSLAGSRLFGPECDVATLDGAPVPLEQRPVHRVLETGVPVAGVRLSVQPSGGPARFLSVSATPLRNRVGELTGVLTLAEDISEQVRMQRDHQRIEAELRQAQKMEAVGRLAGGVAHDFNNMLAVILGVTEMALLDVEPGTQLAQDLREIESAAQQSADLTRQLLAFSRKQVIQPRSVNLSELIENRKGMLRRMIGEAITVDFVMAGDLWNAWIDPTQVDQVLANLLVNARDAIGEVGVITVETANRVLTESESREEKEIRAGDFVMLSVSDTGAGIDPADLEHLFEPFFTTKKEGQGTGLGLSTVYGIVKQNGGSITVESRPGEGTIFKVFLPRHGERSSRPAEQRGSEGLAGTETILLVEDEEVLLKLASRYLEKQGYNVLAAGNPNEAIEKAQSYSGEIDLLLTDVVMPGLNGRELDLQLRKIRPAMRTLYMSGYTADAIAERGILEPGIEFIQKPFAMESLSRQIREVLQKPVVPSNPR